MEKTNWKIAKLQSKKNLPLELLLLADETLEAIEKYIYNSEVYVVKRKDLPEPIAVCALYKLSDTQVEIKNIAVSESLQGRGIGSLLLNDIKRIAAANKYQSIIVGTPEYSSKQVHFYEKNGFRKYDIRKDFFIKNYSAPIVENGIMLRDMVMLKCDLWKRSAHI